MILTTGLFIFASSGWVSQGTENGVSIETRAVPGSSFEAVRVSKTTKVPPAIQAEAVWGVPGIEGVANRKAVSTHIVLQDGVNNRKYYDVISAPMISNRDYVLALDRRHEGEIYELRFNSIDDPAYPPKDGFVRMSVRGSCIVEPSEDGGSIVTYEVFSDLGGSVPAWLARSTQRSSTVEWINVMVGRGEKLAASQRAQ